MAKKVKNECVGCAECIGCGRKGEYIEYLECDDCGVIAYPLYRLPDKKEVCKSCAMEYAIDMMEKEILDMFDEVTI